MYIKYNGFIFRFDFLKFSYNVVDSWYYFYKLWWLNIYIFFLDI